MRYGVVMPLRIPAVLAFTVVGSAAAGALATSCGSGSGPLPDATACFVQCIPSGVGSNACTPPTCATGPSYNICPMGCTPDPVV